MNIGGVEIQVIGDVFLFTTALNVDCDGCPTAYAPRNSDLVPLDNLSNAGHPGNWWGIVASNGVPLLQGPQDPAPGYYISTTAFGDKQKPETDPTRYIDGWTVPYLSVPPELLEAGARKGDVCFVQNTKNGLSSVAIIGDVGPARKLGEGSCALARALGLGDSPRRGGTDQKIVKTMVFCKSTRPWPRSIQDVAVQVNQLLGKMDLLV